MPVTCAAVNCTQRRNDESIQAGITFHCFPKDSSRCAAWVKFMRRVDVNGKSWKPSPHSLLCSKHFTPDMFDRTGQTVRLRENAIPTEFDFPANLQNKIKKGSKKLSDLGSDQTSSTLIDSQCKIGIDLPTYGLDLAQKLLQFQKDGYMCDTTLLANDGKMKAHSVVLAAGSALFKSLLQSHPEPRENIVNFPEFELYVLEIAVQLIYTGELVVPEKYSSEETLSTVVTKLMQLGLVIPHQQQCSENGVNDSDAVNVANDEMEPSELLLIGGKDDVSLSSLPDDSSENRLQTGIQPELIADDNCGELMSSQNEEPITLVNDETSSTQADLDAKQIKLEGQRSVDNDGTEQVLHVCDVCGKHFKSFTNLKIHLRIIHSGARPYVCSQCDRAFTARCNLKRHLRIHTGDRPYLCPCCGVTFIQRNSLIDHMSKYHPEHIGNDHMVRLYRCKHCDVGTFCTSSQLRKHVLLKHQRRSASVGDQSSTGHGESGCYSDDQTLTESPSPTVVCSVCQRKLSTKVALAYHMRQHTGEQPVCRYKCANCDSAFEKASQLKNHVIHRHSGSGPHVCETCGQAFGVLSALKQHMWKHGAGLEHVCHECGKRFATSQSLQIHRLVHSDEKPHQCMECGRRYRQVSHLRQHQLTHSGEKPHHCEMCSKTYKNRLDLRLHCERVHHVVIPIVKRRRPGGIAAEHGRAEVHVMVE